MAEDLSTDLPASMIKGSYEYAHDILITRSELEEKNRLVLSLQNQVDETRQDTIEMFW